MGALAAAELYLGERADKAVLDQCVVDYFVGAAQLRERLLCEACRRDVTRRHFDRRTHQEDDTVHLVHSAGDALCECEQLRPRALRIGGQGEGCQVRVGAPVALHAHRTHWQQDSLHRQIAQFGASLHKVGLHGVEILLDVRLVGAQDADRQPGSGEWLAPDKVLRQTQTYAELANLCESRATK